ncbi:hypothetical protein RM555_09670 [Micromonospora sp. DSM 115977]|uniref:SMI1/KNR4 family protein n=1 Tax=Micromonospora reichwaldensis TaxID=3075516 RepID=A0ABU2WTJ7_9ACTN|nr:hypothetical protein [Micromonospora sp. DSM 115977]MDT0529258.1 hypothetical protein [Micromonospora sp. DSM 115977]
MIVDGLPLPVALVQLIAQGRWVAPADEGRYLDVFGEPPVMPAFLPTERMHRNSRWINKIDHDYRQFYVGSPTPGTPPGDVDPELSLLICDLGPDQPVSLDFRPSLASPSVIYLGEPGWTEVASTIEVFAMKMGL